MSWNASKLTVPQDERVYIAAVAYNAGWSPPYRGLAWNVDPGDGTSIYTTLFESVDGVTWTAHAAGVVFDTGDAYCFVRSLCWDATNSRYLMQYVGPAGGGGEDVGLAYSTDLINWTDVGYVLQNGVAPAPLTTARLFGSGIIEISGTVYMGVDEQVVLDEIAYDDIALYSSSDLAAWTRHGSILQPGAGAEWDAGGILQGCLSYIDGEYVLTYVGSADVLDGSDGGTCRRIGRATADTITGPYTKEPLNPIVSLDRVLLGEPFMFNDPVRGEWTMYLRHSKKPTYDWRSWLALERDVSDYPPVQVRDLGFVASVFW